MLNFVKMPMRGADHSHARAGMPTPTNQPDITKKMKKTLRILTFAAALATAAACGNNAADTAASDTTPSLPAMHYADSTRNGLKISKDPHVIRFKDRYLMYYSMAPAKGQGWTVGIAESRNLTDWSPVAIMSPAGEYESKGFCAPCALVRGDTVHLFYQTYGNNEKDAICHACRPTA